MRARFSAPRDSSQGIPGQLVVVASALAGVTDLLLEGARACRGRARRTKPRVSLRCSCDGIARSRGISCRRVRPGARCSHRSTRPRASTASSAAPSRVLGHIPPRASDILVSRGERMSAALLAAVLSKSGRRAQYVDAAQHRRDRRTARRRRAEPSRDRTTRPACAAAAPRRGHDARRSRLHRAGSRRKPDDARTRRIRSDGDASGRPAWRAEGRAVEGRPRDPHRGSAPGAGRAPDPAAAPSRGGGGRALRREGPASARAHPDRRHADRAARPIVPRSRGARHGSLRAPIDGERIRSRRSRSCGDRRSSPSPARAWSACTALRRGRSAPSRPSGCRSRRSSRHRPRARSDSRSPSRKRRPRGARACGTRSATSSRAA